MLNWILDRVDFTRGMVLAELGRARMARNGHPHNWAGCVSTEDISYQHAAEWMIATHETLRLLESEV